MKKLRPIMFVGTCSDAGKSIVNTAFCRIFKEDGYNPAPFKSQNMSLNSYSTPEGKEIGRAQAVQAEACGINPHTDMNPILLKPTHDTGSQIVLNGEAIGNLSAREYFLAGNKQELLKESLAAFERLSQRYNPIVLEGAGSISEINLRDKDITNMRIAKSVNAVTYLVADIDRGGVFGSVYGSIMLLPEDERKLIKGIIINKFRGDLSLFEEGRKIIKDLTSIPVVGLIPYFKDIHIEEEDSVSLEIKNNRYSDSGKINVAVVLLKHISNFTDFKMMESEGRFHLYYTDNPDEISKADIIILPGSKSTISDLLHIKDNGIAEAIVRAFKNSKKVIGICGGYQMLGTKIEDPDGIEGDIKVIPGIGIMPLHTIIEKSKITLQQEFMFRDKYPCKGYEIHMGRTNLVGTELKPLNKLNDGSSEGYLVGDNCWGTYMHGILDNVDVLNELAEGFSSNSRHYVDYSNFKEENYSKLAKLMREVVDIDYIYNTLSND